MFSYFSSFTIVKVILFFILNSINEMCLFSYCDDVLKRMIIYPYLFYYCYFWNSSLQCVEIIYYPTSEYNVSFTSGYLLTFSSFLILLLFSCDILPDFITFSGISFQFYVSIVLFFIYLYLLVYMLFAQQNIFYKFYNFIYYIKI